MTARAVPVVPAPDCKRGCELSLWVDHQRLLGLQANRAEPCDFCLRHAQLLDSGRRLVVPLRPRGGRRATSAETAAVFDPCTWQEAVETAGLALRQAQLDDHALLWISSGRPSPLDLLPRRIGRLTKQCVHVERRLPRQTIAQLAATASIATVPPEHDLLVFWGGGSDSYRFSELPRIVIDPRAVEPRAGTLHLAVRPGADAVLASAWGARFESSSRVTTDAGGVHESALDDACRSIRAARAPLFVLGPGLGRYPHAAWTVRCIAALSEQLGASLVAPAVQHDLCARAEVPVGGRYRLIGSGALTAALESLTARQTVVVIEGGDPFTIPGHSAALRKFLRHASRVIQFGLEPNTATEFADLVVPVLSPWEHVERCAVPTAEGVREGHAALSSPRDLVGETKFWRRVARSVDWPERWFPAEAQEWIDQTDDRSRAQLDSAECGPSAALRESGEGPTTTPEIYAAYRLWMVPGESSAQSRWDLRDVAGTEVVLAAADAQRRGLITGATAVVHNQRGSLHATVIVSEAQPSGIASIDPAGPGGASLAALAEPAIGGPWGGETWGSFLVEVSPP
ncbi:MAG: hypothetical protein U0V87_09075 [Acidobacteriota bacterium]